MKEILFSSIERKIHLFPEAVVLGSKPREYEVLRTLE